MVGMSEPSLSVVSYSPAGWPGVVHMEAEFQEKPESKPVRAARGLFKFFSVCPLCSCPTGQSKSHGQPRVKA